MWMRVFWSEFKQKNYLQNENIKLKGKRRKTMDREWDVVHDFLECTKKHYFYLGKKQKWRKKQVN